MRIPWRFVVVTLMVCGGVGLVAFTAPQVAVAGDLGDVSSCTDWSYGSCGGEGCTARKKPLFRFCNSVKTYASPPCVFQETCCASAYGSWVAGSCGTSPCYATQRKYTRTSSDSACTYTSKCENATACGYVSIPSPPAPQKYGFAVPDHSPYNFNLPSNSTKTLLGLAAKGNVVIGDYTNYNNPLSVDFSDVVVPKLKPKTLSNPAGVTKSYVVDRTDTDLGYDSLDPSLCAGISPCFNGDYTQQDKQNGLPAFKQDGVTPRKFYETSLSDTSFRALVNPNLNNEDYTSPITIDAVLFTNHAIASLVKAQNLVLNGAMVARDDATVFNKTLTINHDSRLISDTSAAKTIALPFSIGRPKLRSVKECSATSCD